MYSTYFMSKATPDKQSHKINATNYQALDTKIIKKKALKMSDIFITTDGEKTKRKKRKNKVKNKKIKIKNTL